MIMENRLRERRLLMNIHINDDAAQWYKDELSLEKGDHLRFFARYGGCSTVQQGFSLGVANEEPVNAGAVTEKNGILFFIEEKDLWFFNDQNLYVEMNHKANEPVFKYEE
jgi:uncharacterized protein YneR